MFGRASIKHRCVTYPQVDGLLVRGLLIHAVPLADGREVTTTPEKGRV
jgi:hypothetical protein